MVQLAKDQQLEVVPNPLEAHGGEVSFEMSAVLPPKMLPKGKVYLINTFYQYGQQEIELDPIQFKAEDFPNSSSTTSRKSQNFTFAYQDGMEEPGKLMIEGVATDPRNGKNKRTPRLQVATGILTTSRLVQDVYTVAYADHGYNDKEELIPTRINFYFDRDRSNLKYSERQSDRGEKFRAFIAEKNVTRTVTITGTHSPEGPELRNENLSQNRAETIEEYYRRQMDKYDYKGMADSIEFILKPVVKDWTEFKQKLSEYDGITEDQKSEILSIVNGAGTFMDKEDALQKLDSYSSLFRDVYPDLRAAKTEILTVKPKKSNAQIAVLSQKIINGDAPSDTLSAEELLFSATLTPSMDEKEDIYKAATKVGDGSYVAHNNLGALYLEKAMSASGNEKNRLIEDAVTQFEIAIKKAKNAEVYANLASAYAMQGDYEQAYSNAESALDSNPSNDVLTGANGIKGSIEIRRGEYDKATSSLSSAKQDNVNVLFDKGLVQLLKKEYATANSSFEAAIDQQSDYALAHYGLAVVAARQKNSDELVDNLKNAVNAEASLRERALTDLEFSEFSNSVKQAL
ncbi:MAG TPA: tetratricopeptide repeat protein [Cyclobacteriaceae bacterium]